MVVTKNHKSKTAVICPNASFETAFKAARELGYKLFMWRGIVYSTKLREEILDRPLKSYVIKEVQL